MLYFLGRPRCTTESPHMPSSLDTLDFCLLACGGRLSFATITQFAPTRVRTRQAKGGPGQEERTRSAWGL